MKNIKRKYSYVEVYGAEKVLNLSLENQMGINPKEELFVAGGLLNSTADANGEAIEPIKGRYLSHCFISQNGMLVSVLMDENENEYFYRTEPNNFTELNNKQK